MIPPGADFEVSIDGIPIAGIESLEHPKPKRWSDPDANPLVDIRVALDLQPPMWFTPNTIWMSQRVFLAIARYSMPKRRWRRFRGRMKELRRG